MMKYKYTRVTFKWQQHIQKRALLNQTMRKASPLVTRVVCIYTVAKCEFQWVEKNKMKLKSACGSSMSPVKYRPYIRKAFSIDVIFFLLERWAVIWYILFWVRQYKAIEWAMRQKKVRKKYIRSLDHARQWHSILGDSVSMSKTRHTW